MKRIILITMVLLLGLSGPVLAQGKVLKLAWGTDPEAWIRSISFPGQCSGIPTLSLIHSFVGLRT